MRLIYTLMPLLALGCAEPQPSRFEKIAGAYCECTGTLAALNQKAAALASDTNAVASFQEQLRQIQAEYVRAKECAAVIVAQYGKLKPAELDSVKTTLVRKCADPASQGDMLQEMLGE